MKWPEGAVFRVTPGEDAPPEMRRPVLVRVYAMSPTHARNTLRILAIIAARRYA